MQSNATQHVADGQDCIQQSLTDTASILPFAGLWSRLFACLKYCDRSMSSHRKMKVAEVLLVFKS